MDQSIVVVEENHRRSDTVASVPKSVGSVVQISSIAIDISCDMEEIESPKHDHFSIRGFVSGMRKKDWKTCLPFGLDDYDENLVGNLPPFPIPKFRWWHCSQCVPNIGSERTSLALPGSSSHENAGEGKDISFFHIRRTIGDKHDLRDSGYKENSGPSNKMADSSIRLKEDPKAMACCSGAKTDFGGDEHGNMPAAMAKANQILVSARHQTDADDSDAEHVHEVDNASSDSEAAAFCASPNRRKPKLRSLADIMYKEKNSTGEYSRAMSTSSSGMQLKSSEVEADYDPQLHSDVVMDDAKITKSQRKRKNSYKEDRGPSETTSAKRLKSTIGNAEKTWRRVEVPVSGSEGSESVRSDLQHNIKTQLLKPKKNKALDISKKLRQTHIDNRTVPTREVPKTNPVQSAKSQKHGIASATDSGYTGPIPSALWGDTEPHVSSFLSNQRVDRIPHLAKGKWPLGEVGHSSLMPSGKNILRDRNIQRDVALDLSLKGHISAERNSEEQMPFRQHRIIPDLNESFTEKASMIQGKLLPAFSAKSSTPNRPSETPASCSKEAAKEGKRKPGVSNNNTVENGDDIPMEIVELLAKNQRDRALGNSRHHLPPEPGICNSSRGPSTVYADGRAGMFTFPFPNITSSISFASADVGVHPGILNFPRARNFHPEDNRFGPSFNSFSTNGQRKPQYSASNSVMPGPRPSKGSDLLWPPRSKNVPFHLSVAPNSSVRPNVLGGQPFADHFYKGNTFSDFKGKGKITRETPAVKEGRIGSTPQPIGSLDAYSNDTIPAMQLLSLMDQGITSSSSFTVGKNSFLDKPFSPCSHHPRNENLTSPFLGTSLLPRNSHSKDIPVLNGICCNGESSRKLHFGARMAREQGQSKGNPFHVQSKPAVQPPRDDIPLGVCTLNRNPADFTTPDAGSKYTISANDLKARRKNTPRERDRSHLSNVEGQKRQRAARQDTSGKRYSAK